MSDHRVHFLSLPELREHVKEKLAENPFLAADSYDVQPSAEEAEASRRAEEGEGNGE